MYTVLNEDSGGPVLFMPRTGLPVAGMRGRTTIPFPWSHRPFGVAWRRVSSSWRLVRRGTDLGNDPQKNGLRPARLARDRVEAPELVRTVGDHEREPRVDREPELRIGLVVPVEHDAVAAGPGTQARLDLAARRRQQVETLLEGDPDHGVRRERLDRVEDPVEAWGDRTAPGAEVGLVDDQERRAEARGQIGACDAADLEAPRAQSGGRGPG